jgi:hypothetical protein
MTFTKTCFYFLLLSSSYSLFSASPTPSTPSTSSTPATTSKTSTTSTIISAPSSLPASQAQEKGAEALYVSEIIDNGAFIILSDDSVWEVYPKDFSTASIWMFGADITLKQSQDPEYTYIIENVRSHSKVRVKPSTQEDLNLRIEKSFQSRPGSGSLEEPEALPSTVPTEPNSPKAPNPAE